MSPSRLIRERRSQKVPASAGPAPLANDQAIRRDVEHQRHGAERPADLWREAGGIQSAEDVMLDEAAGISGDASAGAKHVLEWRERAYPAAVFDHHAPYSRWRMQPHKPGPAKCHESANDYEGNERRVKQYDGIGQPVIDHANRCDSMRRSCGACLSGPLESMPIGMLSSAGLRRDADPRVNIGCGAAIARTNCEKVRPAGCRYRESVAVARSAAVVHDESGSRIISRGTRRRNVHAIDVGLEVVVDRYPDCEPSGPPRRQREGLAQQHVGRSRRIVRPDHTHARYQRRTRRSKVRTSECGGTGVPPARGEGG